MTLLTHIDGHGVQVFGFALPGTALLPGLSGRGNGGRAAATSRRRTAVEERTGTGCGRLERSGRRVRRLDGRHRRRHDGPRQRRLLLLLSLQRRGRRPELLVMVLAKHRAVAHAELIALGQHRQADGATETRHVENRVPGAHHQLRRRNGRLAPAAPSYAVQPANTRTINIFSITIQ